jgi:hypothetical protein
VFSETKDDRHEAPRARARRLEKLTLNATGEPRFPWIGLVDVIGVGIGLGLFAAGHAADEPRAAAELLVQALEQPGMRFSAGRHRLPRMRPSTLAFMWQIM